MWIGSLSTRIASELALVAASRAELTLMHFEKHLSHAIRTNGGALRPEADNLGDALDMIDEDVPDSFRERPHWRQARNQIIEAAETGSQADIYEATARLVTALQIEGWLG